MGEILLTKTMNGFVPQDPVSQEAAEGFRTGETMRCKYTKARNPQFHRKFFALLNVGYDAWEPMDAAFTDKDNALLKKFVSWLRRWGHIPGAQCQADLDAMVEKFSGEWEGSDEAEKNFEQFREDITILAGYYETRTRLDGSLRVVAKSVSFSKMDGEEFEKLYSSVINVLLNKVLVNYDEASLRKVVDDILGFA